MKFDAFFYHNEWVPGTLSVEGSKFSFVADNPKDIPARSFPTKGRVEGIVSGTKVLSKNVNRMLAPPKPYKAVCVYVKRKPMPGNQIHNHLSRTFAVSEPSDLEKEIG